MVPRGRVLSVTCLALGALLVAAGAGAAVAAVGGLLLGVGVAVALLGAGLLAAGLFVVPVAAPPGEPRQQPIHGVIP